jgi:peptidoglycan/xylan/chitin deacetylase (PgdA/CDA1 family)
LLFPEILLRKQNKNIYLTFDDVPYNKHTFTNILNELAKYNIRATFFVIGSYITPNNCDMLVNAVKQGHALGNHGFFDHNIVTHALMSEDDLIKEINNTDYAIRSIYRKASINLPDQLYFRPGSMLLTRSILRIVKSLSYKIALGSVYPYDSYITNPIINFRYLINHIKGGDIVILHDRPNTQELLKKVLPYLIAQNRSFETLNSN